MLAQSLIHTAPGLLHDMATPQLFEEYDIIVAGGQCLTLLLTVSSRVS